uniref:BBX transcription factor n=1 Tax=Oxybasis rubra TaxID=3560 RepID=A0A9E6SV77_OXYRB|nr:BBX transcription factor [Oxybasis rubra]
MKIQCDVCSKKEASVFCSADEAALCDVCDHRVHHANKLASKHQRFSLIHPSSSHIPICDICQENRALIFCQQDRAILCRECDIPLHTANEHTQKHNRFLLTGVKLSEMISDKTKNNDANTIVSNGNGCDTVPDFKSTKNPTSVSSEKTLNSTASPVTNSSNSTVSSNNNQLNCGGSTSNISEYLIDMLPGWHFEDLLVDSASPAPFGFSKNGSNNHDFGVNEDVLSFFDVENEKELTCSSTNSENFWVPQAATSNIFGQTSEIHQTSGSIYETKQQQQETSVTTMKLMNRRLLKDDAFTVPQITSSVGSKRARPFW